MDSVVHFEMPVENQERMSAFYSGVFGWKMQSFGPEMGNYTTAQTGEVDENRMLKEQGRINGGFFPKEGNPAQHPMVTIAVENIEASMKKITEAGGTVSGGPLEIPDIGKYVTFVDTEGNRVSMLQPTTM